MISGMFTLLDVSTQNSRDSFRSDDATRFSLQVLEANSRKGGVELLEMRPEQLTSTDLGGEQVPVEEATVSLLISPLGVVELEIPLEESALSALLAKCVYTHTQGI